MYLKFFGLREKPFSLLPNTAFLFLGEAHKLAFDLLEYGIAEQTGFVVITGEIGSGKTLLIRQLMKNTSRDIVIGLVTNTHPGFGDTIRWVASAFDLYERDKDKVELYEKFVAFLVQQYVSGRRTVLIIDEAQNLDLAAIEELRMLSNVNCENDFMLQIILVGQPELMRKLKDPSLLQFIQRIGIHYHIEPLAWDETLKYIHYRLKAAGGDPQIFERPACAAVHYFSKGVPRLINIICDLSLVVSYANNRPRVGLDAVIGVAMQRSRSGLSPINAEAATAADVRRAILALCQGAQPGDEPVEPARQVVSPISLTTQR